MSFAAADSRKMLVKQKPRVIMLLTQKKEASDRATGFLFNAENLCLYSEKFKQCLTIVHRQPVTSPLHVEQGYKGQTVTLTLPTAETSGKFCFLVGSAARSKRFMSDLAGSLGFVVVFYASSLVATDECPACTSGHEY